MARNGMKRYSYDDRLRNAVSLYLQGRLPASEYRAMGWMARGDHGLDTPLIATPCCQDLICWASGGLVTHFTSALHIGQVYEVERGDITREAAERFVRGRQLQLVQRVG